MTRSSEFLAARELAADAAQRAALAVQDARARDAMRRACITRNDRRRARDSRRVRVACYVVAFLLSVLAAYTFAGAFIPGV